MASVSKLVSKSSQAYVSIDREYVNDAIKDFMKSSSDSPTEAVLGETFPFTGYISREGKIYECESCQHESIIRWIVLEDYLDEYVGTKASDYDHQPRGMLQEEYFAMKILDFVKVSSFEGTPTKKVLFRYGPLTDKQNEIVYPR